MDDEKPNASRTSALSSKEKEVLQCLLSGMTVTQIAEKLTRSPRTISNKRNESYKKLGISNDSELFKLRHIIES